MRAGILAMLMGLGWSAAHAGGFDLLTAEQWAQAQAAEPRGAATALQRPAARTRSLSAGPQIRVLSPQLGAASLRAPLRIELQFQPVGEARVRPETLKVLYGFLGLDLTAKIRANAQVGEKGVLAEQARIPAGSHTLRIQVSDTLGRVGETELRFSVED